MAKQARKKVPDVVAPPRTVAKVLVIGGGGDYRSAEIYDPSTELWTMTGGTFYERSGDPAILLRNGRVLVVGGNWQPILTPHSFNTELYNPTTGQWYSTGNLHFPRYRGTATLLADGRVLLVGGLDFTFFPQVLVREVELYDPATQVWTATGGLAIGRWEHTATLLGNHKVLVVGASTNPDEPSSEIYDPATGTWGWANAPHMDDRLGHTATLLRDGHVLIVGGRRAHKTKIVVTVSTELYNVGDGNWYLRANLNTARWAHSATLLNDGRVLVVGGYTGPSSAKDSLSSAEVYDPERQVWTPVASLIHGRAGHTATLLPNGKVLVAGGDRDDSRSTAELFDPSTEAWTSTGNLNVGRGLHGATLVTVSDTPTIHP